MNLQESGEMYLETIYILSQKYKDVRAIDVGEYMGYSKPSVSRAVGLLKSGGYLVSDELGHLSLTESGVAAAQEEIVPVHGKSSVSPQTRPGADLSREAGQRGGSTGFGGLGSALGSR